MPKHCWNNNILLPQTKKHEVSYTNREKGEIFTPFLAFTNAKYTSVPQESWMKGGPAFRILGKPVAIGRALQTKPYGISGTKKRKKWGG
jgi:hypothetical protein